MYFEESEWFLGAPEITLEPPLTVRITYVHAYTVHVYTAYKRGENTGICYH